jgi:hypothetical protein
VATARQAEQRLVELCGSAGSDDRDWASRLGAEPGQGHGRGGDVELVGNADYLVRDREVALGESVIVERQTSGLGAVASCRPVLAAEQPASQWPPCKCAESEVLAHREQLALGRAFGEVVLDLDRREAGSAGRLCQRVGAGDGPCRRVGDPDVEHLAGSDRVVEQADEFVEGVVWSQACTQYRSM